MKRIIITPGEPAGVGPEITVKFLQQPLTNCEIIVCADPDLIERTAHALKCPLSLHEFSPAAPILHQASHCSILPVQLADKVVPGKLNSKNSSYVLKCLTTAVEVIQAKQAEALVTGPVHKGIINDAGIPFSGHTELLANQTHTEQVVMMLTANKLRVALVTTHLPLREVADSITAEKLTRVIQILHDSLKSQYKIEEPNILVTGLNPHAGEGGHLGYEEIEIISPVIEDFQSQGLSITGPYPADTVFTEKYLKQADAVLAMYHDQGLPVLKHVGFGDAVNVTLGMPIVRTSVDHGVALDLAGRDIASESSLAAAVNEALNLSAD